MSMEPQQTKEDQLQTPEPERPDSRIQAQTELKAASIANLKLFTGLCARDDDVFGWQTRARHPPDT